MNRKEGKGRGKSKGGGRREDSTHSLNFVAFDGDVNPRPVQVLENNGVRVGGYHLEFT